MAKKQGRSSHSHLRAGKGRGAVLLDAKADLRPPEARRTDGAASMGERALHRSPEGRRAGVLLLGVHVRRRAPFEGHGVDERGHGVGELGRRETERVKVARKHAARVLKEAARRNLRHEKK